MKHTGLGLKGVGSGGLLALAAAAGLFVGCATSALYPPPTAGQIAAAESAVAVARQDGRTGDPDATRHLRWAEQQLAQAKDAAAKQDNRGAALMLARAQADAELSQTLSRKARNEGEAVQAEAMLAEARSTPAAPQGSAAPQGPAAPQGSAAPQAPVQP
jgi:hypothetical protein